MKVNKLFLFLLVLLITANAVFAQTSNADNPNCNPNFAKILVEQQVSESKSLDDTNKRIKILLRSADFLWSIDEETARKFFAEAFQTAETRYKEKGFESKTVDGLKVNLPDYRFDIISSISKKDPAWAKTLYEKVLKEYDEIAEKEKRDSFNQDREISELLKIATQTAVNNPSLTLQIVRRLMRHKLSFHWYFAIYEIARNNQPLADQIYGELLLNYANAEVYRLLYLSAYPFGNERIFGIEKYSLGASVPPDFTTKKNLQIQFLNLFFRKVMTLTPENNSKSLQTAMPETAIAKTALKDMESLIYSDFPELVETFNRTKVFADSLVTNEMLDSIKAKEKWQSEFNLSFDDKIKKLEKLDGEGKLKDSDIVTLVISLKTAEQYEKTSFWILKMADSKAREDTFNLFHFKYSQLAVNENRLTDAQKYADKVDDLSRRAILYFQIAESELKTNNNRFQTLDILSKVYKLAEKSEDSVSKAQIFFGLAFMYAKIDFSSANDSLSNALKVTNKLENPDIFQTSTVLQIKTKELTHYTVYSTVGFDMEVVFKELAEKDLSLTLGQAESFADKYFRTLAIISTLGNCTKPKVEIKPKTKIKK